MILNCRRESVPPWDTSRRAAKRLPAPGEAGSELGADAEVPAGLADVAEVGVPGRVELEDQEVERGAKADAEPQLGIGKAAVAVHPPAEAQGLAPVPDRSHVPEHRATQVEDADRHRTDHAELLDERETQLGVYDRHPRAEQVEVAVAAQGREAADLEGLRVAPVAEPGQDAAREGVAV